MNKEELKILYTGKAKLNENLFSSKIIVNEKIVTITRKKFPLIGTTETLYFYIKDIKMFKDKILMRKKENLIQIVTINQNIDLKFKNAAEAIKFYNIVYDIRKDTKVIKELLKDIDIKDVIKVVGVIGTVSTIVSKLFDNEKVKATTKYITSFSKSITKELNKK